MKCIEEEDIQRYIDQETTIEETKYIEFHIASCIDCKQKYLNHKKLCDEFVHSFNKIHSHEIIIPEFKYPKAPKRSLKSKYKKLVYTISAASIIAFAYFYFNNTNAGYKENLYMNSYDEIFDANKSIGQQGIMITISDADGQTTEFNLK